MRIDARKGIIVAASLVIVVYALYTSLGPIAVYLFSKANGISVSYKSLRVRNGNFSFRGLAAADKRTGIGIYSDEAEIKPIYRLDRLHDMGVDFCLSKVNFIKEGSGRRIGYDSLEELLAVPFESNWSYREIRGLVYFRKDDIHIDSFSAKSDEITLEVAGDINGTEISDLYIKIRFSAAVTDRIPQELSKAILEEEPDGWRSLSVRLSGNLASPSISISSKLFRLNIKTVN